MFFKYLNLASINTLSPSLSCPSSKTVELVYFIFNQETNNDIHHTLKLSIHNGGSVDSMKIAQNQMLFEL